ncbi:unnamed protein product [Linum trigynum]|uniref:Uncharacterized protein n=1 Tax=Linum trigynum TaxID=586398 RepID=A0AAV2GF92_9ROSI
MEKPDKRLERLTASAARQPLHKTGAAFRLFRAGFVTGWLFYRSGRAVRLVFNNTGYYPRHHVESYPSVISEKHMTQVNNEHSTSVPGSRP